MKICLKCNSEKQLSEFNKDKRDFTNLQPLCSYTNRHIKRDSMNFKNNIL